MSRARAFLAFWYDFVIGDDWRIAAAVVAGLITTWAISTTSVAAWWVMPVTVALVLATSLWKAIAGRG